MAWALDRLAWIDRLLCHIYTAVHTSHTHSSRYIHMHASTRILNSVAEVSVLSMAMPLWVPSGKLRSRLHLWELWPGATEPVCTVGRPDWILLSCIMTVWIHCFYYYFVSLFTKITLATNVRLLRSRIPAWPPDFTTASFPFDTVSFLLFLKLDINSVGLYCLVFCLLVRCASIRHQLPATFTGCKHLGEAFHLVNVARGPRGSGLEPW